MKNTNLSISNGILRMLDFLFHVMHIFIILLFLFGWMLEMTRFAHYILAILILVSWYGLGMIYGFGYCVITDIQWKIKKVLGQQPHTEYYIKYLMDKATGLDTNSNKINMVTTYTYFAILIISTICISNTFFKI